MIRIGVTMGDPAGVGPEVLLRAIGEPAQGPGGKALVYGDRAALADAARLLGCKVCAEVLQTGELSSSARVPGRFTEEGGRAQGAYLQAATRALLDGEIDALVTGPIHKKALKVCGMQGPGQTEYLTSRFGVERSVMMLAGPDLKVVLATTHVALRDVPRVLEQKELVETIWLAWSEMKKRFSLGRPRLAVAALNPHGEEEGEQGLEEREIIVPAIKELQARGVDVSGPVAGDTVFALARQGRYDAVVALYHDQGLAAIKTLNFSSAVNVTLGLGVIRTSPDHGVAYDIAGRGIADPSSMRQALQMAAEMVHGARQA